MSKKPASNYEDVPIELGKSVPGVWVIRRTRDIPPRGGEWPRRLAVFPRGNRYLIPMFFRAALAARERGLYLMVACRSDTDMVRHIFRYLHSERCPVTHVRFLRKDYGNPSPCGGYFVPPYAYTPLIKPGLQVETLGLDNAGYWTGDGPVINWRRLVRHLRTSRTLMSLGTLTLKLLPKDAPTARHMRAIVRILNRNRRAWRLRLPLKYQCWLAVQKDGLDRAAVPPRIAKTHGAWLAENRWRLATVPDPPTRYSPDPGPPPATIGTK